MHSVGHFPLHHRHPTIYNITRSTLPLTCTKLIQVDRLGSGVRVNHSFQIFTLTVGECPKMGEKLSGELSEGIRPGEMSYTLWSIRSRQPVC